MPSAPLALAKERIGNELAQGFAQLRNRISALGLSLQLFQLAARRPTEKQGTQSREKRSGREAHTYAYISGIVTICIDSEEGVAFDVNPPEWENDPDCRVSVLETIALELSQPNAVVAVILRTLTSQIDPQYNVPIKEIRGYRLSTSAQGELQCFCLPQATLFNCCTTDAETGEPVPPEADVVYLGDEEFTLR